ncbi:fungal-specific transcription factor domain-containing protein [Aspergillus carlsbadensis]|nr:fungal-specific transcription factor domain-containing protein [Aspergillus carlsbadensis]
MDTASADTLTDPAAAKRKRSRVACDFCHSRKVRCDLTVTGAPCTNCRLDKQSCFVRESRHKRTRKANAAAQRTSPAASPGQLTTTFPSEIGLRETSADLGDLDGLLFNLPFDAFSPSGRAFPAGLDGLSSIPPMMGDPTTSSDAAALDKSIIFSYYEFLELKDLSRLSPSDVRYLDSKGCFRVPARPYLDEFLRKYFLHIHPCYPVVDEAEFWSLYNQEGLWDGRSKISLMLFQAMVFAASAYVSLRTLRAIGIDNILEARDSLHRRAALLHQFRADTDNTTVAQVGLLLSFNVSPMDVYNNTSFLTIALQAARATQAHLYKSLTHLPKRQRAYKKRLWWCCVVRDRCIALGMRRPLQITPDTFNPREEPLVEEDMEGEMAVSKVYDIDIKRCLTRVFVVQCDLAAALTSTLMTVAPPNSLPIPVSATYEDLLRIFAASEGCRQELQAWFKRSEEQLRHASRTGLGRTRFMTLYVDLQWIYYFTAQMALSHLIIFASSTTSHALRPEWIMRLDISKSDLLTAFTGLKNVYKRLVASNLVGYLPISATAYTAFPLLLVSLDVELSKSEREKGQRMQDLSVCAEAMKQFSHRFRFAQFVSDIVCKVLQLLNGTSWSVSISRGTQNPAGESSTAEIESRPQAWSDVYLQAPQLYFKLLFSLEHSLCWGKMPSSAELPDWSRAHSASSHDISPRMGKSSDKRRVSSASGPVQRLSRVSSSVTELPQDMSSQWISHDQWNSLLSLPPSLPDPVSVYAEDATGLDSSDGILFPLAPPTGLPYNAQAASGDTGGAGSDGGETISGTLSQMLQYSCPAIG